MPDTTVVSLRVPDALAARLNALADARGVSLSQVLRDAARAFLRPPVTLCAATGGRLRLQAPAWPIGGENPNLCVPETLSLTHTSGGTMNAMTDTVELLRAASRKIRANAKDATPGTRDIEPDADSWRIVTFEGKPVATTGSLSDALHAAQWSREAALAVADWLDTAAERGEAQETQAARAVALAVLDPEPVDAGRG